MKWQSKSVWVAVKCLLILMVLSPFSLVLRAERNVPFKSTLPVERNLLDRVDQMIGLNAHEWVGKRFAKNAVPPFSFSYGGEKSDKFLRSWQYTAKKIKSTDPNVEEYLFTYFGEKRGLMVKCFVKCFNDFQAVEWVLKFSNTLSVNTPVLQEVKAIDQNFEAAGDDHITLHHIKGSKGGKDDFKPQEDTLQIGKPFYFTPAGGRSSDNTVCPFFNIKTPGSTGLVLAIGWTGKWYTDICRTGETNLSIKAGMEKMKLTLYPGEEIRSPSICLLFWKGSEQMAGHNQFRQFVLKHKTRSNSRQLPLAESLSPNSPAPCNGFFGCLSDTFAFAKIAKLKEYDLVPEVCWIDAGWYLGGGDNWQVIGNWRVDKSRFPNGFKPVSDAIHAIGAKFLLWFEPERVVEGTQLAIDHDKWLLKLPGDKKNAYTGKKDYVFNMGIEEARLWLTDYISDFLKKEGVDYFRQDFNIDPQNYWNLNDLPDRVGMSEIRHIEGLYAFWDSLLVRFPNLVIDNCASGGRRIDLETISRSSALWRSDYQMDEPEGLQNHTYGLNYYLPFHGTGNLSSNTYDFRSCMSSTMVLFWDLHNAGNSIPQMQKCMKDFVRLRPFYTGNYYPLTGPENLLRSDRWLAYQLSRPQLEDGIVMAFRRKGCAQESILVKLQGLDKNANYELFNEDTGEKIIQNGGVISKGITLSLTEKRKSLLLSFKKVIH